MMNITEAQLKGSYSEGEAMAIYLKVKQDGNYREFIQSFLYNDDYQVTRNALWGLTKATNKELEPLQPLLNELIDKAINETNSSVQRLTLNIIEKLKMKEENLRTDFLDFCLEEMVNIESYPGIQTLCMKLAYRMCKFYPELYAEFEVTLQNMEIDYYKPAVKCLRKRILSGKFK